MDKKIANNIIVGVFILLGILGFVFVIFSMGNGRGFLSPQFTLYGKFSNVKGLHYGSEVSLAGLRVGVVKNITVSDTETKELIVELSLSRSVSDRIRQDSVATIRTQGVLGDKYIEISIGTPSLPALEDGSMIQTSELSDLFTKGGNLVEGINRYFEKGSKFDDLIINLNQVAHNLATITSQVRQQKGLLHEMIYGTSGEKMSRAVGHLEAIASKIDRGDGTLGALVNDPTVYEDLKHLLGGAKRSSVLNYFMRQLIESGEKEKSSTRK